MRTARVYLRELVIYKEILEIHLLKKIKKLTISEDCSKKMKRRIKKLREINPEVETEFV